MGYVAFTGALAARVNRALGNQVRWWEIRGSSAVWSNADLTTDERPHFPAIQIRQGNEVRGSCSVRLVPAYCSLCASDEYTSEEKTEDGRVFAVCSGDYHGEQPYAWELTPTRQSKTRGDGLGSELDIWDKLLECVPADGSVHAYGIVEDRLFERYPAEAAILQDRYGHRWRDGKKSSSSFSMSVYLAARLSELADEKLLVKTFGPAEGSWSYNGIISHWQRI